MTKTSTPLFTSSATLSSSATGGGRQAATSPSARTLAILRQFARVYHADPSLSPRLAPLILN